MKIFVASKIPDQIDDIVVMRNFDFSGVNIGDELLDGL